MFALFRLYSTDIYWFLTGKEHSLRLHLGQRFAFWMVIAHYFKLVFEALTIEHFDAETIGHNILAFKMAKSWLWQGSVLAYYTFHPFYTG